MATFIVKNRPTFLGRLDMSQIASAVAIEYGADAVDDTVLTDSTRSNAGGLKTFGFSMDAYADFSTYDADIQTYHAGSVPISFATEAGTEQETCFLVNATQLTHQMLSGSVGDMAGTNISGSAVGNLVRGILEANRAVSSTGTSTGSQLGALSTAQSIYANLHVTAAAGTTIDVIVQSDDNGSFTSPTTRMTFTQATGRTAEHLNLAGAVTDDYWRISYTVVGGAFTFAVSIGIL